MTRWLVFFATASLAGVLVFLGATGAIQRAEVPYPSVRLDALVYSDLRMAALDQELGEYYNVVLLGDSLTQGGSPAHLNMLPGELESALRRGVVPRADLGFWSLAYSGLSVYSFYFMSDRISELHPEVVVLEFNLSNLSEWWARRERVELASWLPASQWSAAALLPLARVGVSADRLIFGRLVIGAGLLPAWHWLQREQGRVASAYWSFGDWAQRSVFGDDLVFRTLIAMRTLLEALYGHEHRASAQWARTMLGPALDGVTPDHPALVMLAAAIDQFRSEDSDVIVYVPPHNVAHLARIGMLDGSHLSETLQVIRSVVETHGGSFLDLHDRLPDRAFRDHMDHLVHDGPDYMAPQVADWIGEAIREARGRRVARQR